MDISIFGLGYVGSVTAACFAKNGHNVVGTDIKEEKVDAINEGRSPLFEKDLDKLIEECVNLGKLSATASVEGAINKTECSLICVGTPSNLDGSINLEHLKRVCSEIGAVLASKDDYHVVALRSTILPGTAEDTLIPILKSSSKKKNSSDFGVCVNPEFMREGHAIADFYNPERIVIGSADDKSGDSIERIYNEVDAPVVRVGLKTAEMIKYVDNSFHGMKVAFANEVGSICKKVGIDGRELMDVFCMDHKLNLAPYYFTPGFAFGGSCIPKDLRAIIHKSKELETDCVLLESVLNSNQKHIERAVEIIIEQGKRNIGIFGLTFKSGTEDTRESPAIPLITKLLEKGYLKLFEKGYVIRLHDPDVNLPEVKEILPHIAPLIDPSLEEVVQKSEILVITKNDEAFKKVTSLIGDDQILIDLVGAINPQNMKSGKYIGICW